MRVFLYGDGYLDYKSFPLYFLPVQHVSSWRGAGKGECRTASKEHSGCVLLSDSRGLPTPLSRWCDQSQGRSRPAAGADAKGKVPSFPGSPRVPAQALRVAAGPGASRGGPSTKDSAGSGLRGVPAAPRRPRGALAGRQSSAPTTASRGCLDRRVPPGISLGAPLGRDRGGGHHTAARPLGGRGTPEVTGQAHGSNYSFACRFRRKERRKS